MLCQIINNWQWHTGLLQNKTKKRIHDHIKGPDFCVNFVENCMILKYILTNLGQLFLK